MIFSEKNKKDYYKNMKNNMPHDFPLLLCSHIPLLLLWLYIQIGWCQKLILLSKHKKMQKSCFYPLSNISLTFIFPYNHHLFWFLHPSILLFDFRKKKMCKKYGCELIRSLLRPQSLVKEVIKKEYFGFYLLSFIWFNFGTTTDRPPSFFNFFTGTAADVFYDTWTLSQRKLHSIYDLTQ